MFGSSFSGIDFGVPAFDTSAWGSNYNLGDKPKSKPKSGGKSMFDPLSAGITAAGMGIQGLFGAIGASKQANTWCNRC
jgi:hypothetical protein